MVEVVDAGEVEGKLDIMDEVVDERGDEDGTVVVDVDEDKVVVVVVIVDEGWHC